MNLSYVICLYRFIQTCISVFINENDLFINNKKKYAGKDDELIGLMQNN